MVSAQHDVDLAEHYDRALYGPDLSLIEAIHALMSSKWLVAAGCAAGAVLGLLLGFFLRPVYQAEVLIDLQQGSQNQLQRLAQRYSGLAAIAGIDVSGSLGDDTGATLATLSSYQLLSSFITSEDIRKELMQGTRAPIWLRWMGAERDSMWEAVQRFRAHLQVEKDKETGLVHVQVQWYEPETASRWANRLVGRADATLRERALRTSRLRLEQLKRQLETTALVSVRDALSNVMEGELRTIAMAQADEEFALRVIDPAITPETPIRPRTLLIIVLMMMLGTLASAVWVLAAAVRARARRALATRDMHAERGVR